MAQQQAHQPSRHCPAELGYCSPHRCRALEAAVVQLLAVLLRLPVNRCHGALMYTLRLPTSVGHTCAGTVAAAMTVGKQKAWGLLGVMSRGADAGSSVPCLWQFQHPSGCGSATSCVAPLLLESNLGCVARGSHSARVPLSAESVYNGRSNCDHMKITRSSGLQVVMLL